jgi:hypothetical protein
MTEIFGLGVGVSEVAHGRHGIHGKISESDE